MFLLIGLQLLHSNYLQAQLSVNMDTTHAAVKFLKNWEKDFLSAGLTINNDSLQLNEEEKKLIIDADYRRLTYPAVYNWKQAIELMNRMDLKKSFWHIMNLYGTDTAHKELALQTFVLYDSLVDMEKILVNSFYTYALTDPEIAIIKNGKPQIVHPDILETKFNKMKEIVNYILFYRNYKKNLVKKE